MKDLYLIGAGGHCASCIDVIRATGVFNIRGIFDLAEKVGSTLNGVPIIGTDADLPKYINKKAFFLITVGQIKTPQLRKKIFQQLVDLGAQLATVISPRAYVSASASIGEGTIVLHDALVNANAIIGVNCIVNTKSLIEHDSVVGSHCHVSTAAVINGGCNVQEGSFIGSNAVLKEGLKVAANSVLSAGVFHKVSYE
ncbi:NeuD/PglB/VioB family sugar acetyltransferase [Bdellovibrio bacteriovorus]|uniref:NeuD/PglB/VioB family sugar acetyltransferase n=1 Tax=Bdellovibrio bacteriovorus TaxID=959 RepID=UPI0035A660C3